MKQFIEKLIGRLEELKILVPVNKVLDNIIESKPKELGQLIAYEKSIKAVNELAEEYINTSTDTSSGWIACSERLPEANQKVLTCDKDGWISVNVNMPYIGVRNDFECGYYVAWQPLPAPYKERDKVE